MLQNQILLMLRKADELINDDEAPMIYFGVSAKNALHAIIAAGEPRKAFAFYTAATDKVTGDVELISVMPAVSRVISRPSRLKVTWPVLLKAWSCVAS